jgi:hypothetical protein
MMITSIEIREIKHIRPFSLDDFIAGLPRPKTLAWLPPVPNSIIARAIIEEQVPTDGVEIVEVDASGSS